MMSHRCGARCLTRPASYACRENAVKLVDVFTTPNLVVAKTGIKAGQLKLLCCSLWQQIKAAQGTKMLV